MKKLGSYVLLLLFLLAMYPADMQAKKKKKPALSLLARDSVGADLSKIKKDATVKKGLFTVYFNEKTGKLHFSVPKKAMEQYFMLSSRISSTSDGDDYVAGQMNVSPILIRFSTDNRNVYIHQVQKLNALTGNDPMAPAFSRSNLDPVMKGFKVAARDGDNLVIDVTNFFSTNEKWISPLKESSPVGKLLGSDSKLKGTFQADASGIREVGSFEQNIEITSLLSYITTGAVSKPYSVIVHRSLCALPEDPMPMRLQDNRVGYFILDKNVYSTDEDRIRPRTYINRWRIEPKPEDRERYFKGELVEPAKQIVFYVDSAFPEKWRGTIKEGIEVWNKAFEKAGFKNVLKAVDYPKNDSLFNPDDMRYNCFRYVATSTANAMGPSYIDPRTGEILSADVIWYHNIVSLLHNWRFVQTGAVDKRARALKFDDDIMCEAIKYAASHEVGHTLGLMHNMGASYSYPVEKLRDPAFTQKYGTTPSIMDYARNNYVAQPGDLERGVKLTPPEIGIYDIYAINWGYRLIPGANTPDDEKATLDKWIAEKAADPMYEFGAQQLFATIDPTDQTEDLGNDHIKASNYGISNLKLIVANFDKWLLDKGERYDEIDNVYREITKQYNRYVKHVVPYIGGIRYEEIRQGDNRPTGKHHINKVETRRAVDWLLGQARTCDDWLIPRGLLGKIEIDLDSNEKLRSQIVSSLLNSAALYRIEEGGVIDSKTNYQLDDYLEDVTQALFKAPQGGKLSRAEQQLESAAVAFMMKNSGLAQGAAAKTSSFADDDDECFCNWHQDFARLNFGVSSLPKERMGALMMGRLNKVLVKYRQFRTLAKGSTRDYYDYQILQIERLLSNK